MLSGMGADELFAGYRKHLANLLALRYQRVPRPLRAACPAAVGPAAGRRRRPRAAVACASRSASSPSPSCPRRPRSGAATPCTTRTSCSPCVDPDLAGTVDDVLTEHADVYAGQRPRRLRQPHVPGRRPDVPAGPEPRLHRPVEHGRLDRGAGAVRRRRGGQGGVRRPRRSQDRRPAGQGRPQGGGRASILPQEIVYRPKGLFSAPLRAWMQPRPGTAGATRSSTTACSSTPGSCGATRWRGWSPRTPPAQQDRSKHLWHLLTLEYWYRDATSAPAEPAG